MARYRITESVGGSVERVGSFEDLEKHHPSSGREAGRSYETIDGALEEVRRTDDGRTLVKKDFILSQDTPGAVSIPAPAAGYVHHLNDATNAVRIYDRPFGEDGARLLAQSLHMERGTSPAEGARIEYGQPIGRMGDTGSPGSVHAHVEMEAAPYQAYVRDIANGTIAPGRYPEPGTAGLASVAGVSQVLRLDDRGPQVSALQEQLNAQGARDAQGRVLAVDGRFGDSTREAVEAYQRAHGLGVDGIAGRDTTTALRGQPADPQPRTRTPVADDTARVAGQQPQLPPAAGGGSTALSNLIGSGEGGYDSYNRGRAGDSSAPLALSGMTVGEIMRQQALPAGDPQRLFAVGKFQMIPGTMRETVDALGIDRSERFTPALQERMFADHLIDEKRPRVHAYITGQSSGAEGLERAQVALAQEFASVADPRTGRSYYDGDSAGNHSSISAAQSRVALDEMRAQYQVGIDRGLTPAAAYQALDGQAATPAQSTGSLRVGDDGPQVNQLQQHLNALGVRDAQGRALGVDGDFGTRTREAVEGFQRGSGLTVDGVVGRDTHAALGRALQPTPPSAQPRDVDAQSQAPRDADPSARTPAQPLADLTAHAHAAPSPARTAAAPLLSDSAHPQHALYGQARTGIDTLPAAMFRSDAERSNAAATLAFEASVSGVRRIDHVVASRDGSGLFGVEGELRDPAHLRVYVDRAQAAGQSVEQSSQKLAQDQPLQPTPQVASPQVAVPDQQQEQQRRNPSLM